MATTKNTKGQASEAPSCSDIQEMPPRPAKPLRTVTVSGYYGNLNTGDDALAATVAWGVHRYLAPKTIRVPSWVELAMPNSVPAIFLAGRSFSRIRSLFWRTMSDLHVFGGGSVLHDQGGLSILNRRITLARHGKRLGCRTAGIGVSIGPIWSEEGRVALKRLLQHFTCVCVRDEESRRLAEEFGPDIADRVVVTMDPAVLLDQVGLPEPVSLSSSTCPTLVVAPCPYESVVGQDANLEKRRQEKLVASLNMLCETTACRVQLLVFNGSPTVGDQGLCRAIAEALPDGRAEVIDYDANPLVALRVIQNADLLLGMRLHAVIFAYTAQTPFIALNYHAKVRRFCQLVGTDEKYVLDTNDFIPEDLADLMRADLSRQQPRQPASLPLCEAQARALQSFELLRCSLGID